MMNEQQMGVTLAEALLEAATALRKAGVAEARREAATLLMHAHQCDRAYLVTHSDERIADEELARFRLWTARRATGEPLQYITGRQEFYGLEFEVTPDVLIPRPETELLVETALELLRDTSQPLICDVGTGSGCISVALLHERQDARAIGLDISPPALLVAARNAARHDVAARLTLHVSDCFDVLHEGAHERTRFDIVVSNPPYIPEADIAGLQPEVREHEPRHALTPGGDDNGDGLRIIRRLIAEASQFLNPRGHLILEMGYGQADAVRALIDPRVWTLHGIHADLQGIPRIVALSIRQVD
ncbi:MAG: peptide chain release factor N(5)-glutamine methyltransferase [Acidobacteria bacterium]|nr:peptide chain release factor N(5)-glutamine methyltransferase [Acidobacteriota bacterium]